MQLAYEQSMRLVREKDRGIKTLRTLTAKCDQLDGVVANTERAKQDVQIQLETKKREAVDFANIVPTVGKE